ncbi:hypothetical protein DCO57_22775 [Labrenzia sp. 011]|nr:hypothetical protein DCO57_22775 [Labrenzia sp. 011]
MLFSRWRKPTVSPPHPPVQSTTISALSRRSRMISAPTSAPSLVSAPLTTMFCSNRRPCNGCRTVLSLPPCATSTASTLIGASLSTPSS